jgi:hypothetical protein
MDYQAQKFTTPCKIQRVIYGFPLTEEFAGSMDMSLKPLLPVMALPTIPCLNVLKIIKAEYGSGRFLIN